MRSCSTIVNVTCLQISLYTLCHKCTNTQGKCEFFFLQLLASFSRAMGCSRPATFTQVESQMKSTDESFHMSGPGTALTHLLESEISGDCRALCSHQTVYSPSGFFRCFLLLCKPSHGIQVTLCQMIITAIASCFKLFERMAGKKSSKLQTGFTLETAVCKIASGSSK